MQIPSTLVAKATFFWPHSQRIHSRSPEPIAQREGNKEKKKKRRTYKSPVVWVWRWIHCPSLPIEREVIDILQKHQIFNLPSHPSHLSQPAPNLPEESIIIVMELPFTKFFMPPPSSAYVAVPVLQFLTYLHKRKEKERKPKRPNQCKNPYEEGCCTGEDVEDVKQKWEDKKHYFEQYKKDVPRPPCIDLDRAILGFNIDNSAAFQAIEDSKALHARRWQTKGRKRRKLIDFARNCKQGHWRSGVARHMFNLMN